MCFFYTVFEKIGGSTFSNLRHTILGTPERGFLFWYAYNIQDQSLSRPKRLGKMLIENTMPKKCKLIFSSPPLCQGYFGWIKTTGNVYIANLNLNRKFP